MDYHEYSCDVIENKTVPPMWRLYSDGSVYTFSTKDKSETRYNGLPKGFFT